MVPYEMDEVDKRYRDSIREALQSKDVDRLMQLVPSLGSSEAQDYIDRYDDLYLKTMAKIRLSKDTQDEIAEMYEILDGLLVKADLSGPHHGR